MNEKTTFYKDYISLDELPSWDDVLENLEFNLYKNHDSTRIGENLSFVTVFNNRIKKVEALRNKIHKLRPDERTCTAHLYISMLTTSKTFGWHKDDTEVFFIQGLGKTKWEVEEDGHVLEFELSPGDMLYCPKGLKHNTTPLSARVGISIGFT